MTAATTVTRRDITRALLAGSALVLGGSPFVPARAQNVKYKLRYGTAFPASHPGAVRIKEASTAIAKETNGEVDLQVYPDSQLGSEPDMFSQTRFGALDFMSTSGVNQTVVPVGGINAIAFAFENYDKVWAAMDGDLGDYVRAQFAKIGVFAFPKVLDNGFRNITSGSKPINGPDDLKGFKIRVPGNQLWVTTFTALGASPTPVNFGELYAALQTHLVDGQENPLALIDSAKLYEVQKYIALSGHIWDGHYIFASQKRWNSLPSDVRTVIEKNLSDAAVKERGDIVVMNKDLVDKLTKAGVIFNTPDKQPFRDKLKAAGFYTEWKGKFGNDAWSLLEKYSGPL